MAKQSASEQAEASSVKSHGLLRGLIDALYHLITTISARLRHMRIQGSPMGDAKGEYDIWEKVGNHVEQISADSKPAKKSRRTITPKSKVPDPREPVAVAARDSNQLTEHSKQEAVNRLLPSMSAQLQSKTMEHINISLIMAKEGNKDGARLHIDLAENAMHTASRFMSHEEYALFERKIEQRLKSIVDRGGSDNAGT